MATEAISVEITQVKKPKDMTPEEYLLYKRKLHNERMRRYLNAHPEKRVRPTPEQVKRYNENQKEYKKEYMREYMKEYMKSYMRKERTKLNEIKESLKEEKKDK